MPNEHQPRHRPVSAVAAARRAPDRGQRRHRQDLYASDAVHAAGGRARLAHRPDPGGDLHRSRHAGAAPPHPRTPGAGRKPGPRCATAFRRSGPGRGRPCRRPVAARSAPTRNTRRAAHRRHPRHASGRRQRNARRLASPPAAGGGRNRSGCGVHHPRFLRARAARTRAGKRPGVRCAGIARQRSRIARRSRGRSVAAARRRCGDGRRSHRPVVGRPRGLGQRSARAGAAPAVATKAFNAST